MRVVARVLLICLVLLPRAAHAQGSARDAVARLYARYAWETNDNDQSRREPLQSENAAVLRRYLDEPLVKAFLADRACQARVEGECNLEFAPMWDSQDPGGATVNVVATHDPSIVQARVHYPFDHSTTKVVTYHLRHTTAGWRIVDMAGAEWPSLLHLLRRPVR